MSGSDPLLSVVLELAERLLHGDGVPEILTRICERCVEVFPVAGAGVVIYGDDPSTTESVAASDPEISEIERAQIRFLEGPCLTAWETGAQVEEPDVTTQGPVRWPRFGPVLVRHGIASVASVPLVHQQRSIGALNLFRRQPGQLDDGQLSAAQTLAGAATIFVLHSDRLRSTQETIRQLQEALESRIVIEQAKGKLSHQLGVGVEDSFQILRRHARNANRRIHDVASDVVEDRLTLGPEDMD